MTHCSTALNRFENGASVSQNSSGFRSSPPVVDSFVSGQISGSSLN